MNERRKVTHPDLSEHATEKAEKMGVALAAGVLALLGLLGLGTSVALVWLLIEAAQWVGRQ